MEGRKVWRNGDCRENESEEGKVVGGKKRREGKEKEKERRRVGRERDR